MNQDEDDYFCYQNESQFSDTETGGHDTDNGLCDRDMAEDEADA